MVLILLPPTLRSPINSLRSSRQHNTENYSNTGTNFRAQDIKPLLALLEANAKNKYTNKLIRNDKVKIQLTDAQLPELNI